MKEIGSKFQKLGRVALTTVTSDIMTASKDSLPELETKSLLAPTDDIILLTLNNCKLYIYSQKSAGIHLYRMLNYTKPSSILLQLRPDDINPPNPSLEVGPEEVIPSVINYNECLKSLKESGFFIGPTSIRVENRLNHWRDQFSERTSIFSSIWAMQHGLESLHLADIPRSLLYRYLTHNLTLMQLQSMFTIACKTIGAKPDTFDVEDVKVPLTVAYKLYPDVWEKPSVHYFAKNLIKASLDNKNKKVFCIAQRGIGKKVESLIQNEGKIINTDVDLFHTSIVRKDSSEMVIEKIALLDNFSYGLNIWQKIANHHASKRANEFIKEVLNNERAESNFTISQKHYLERMDLLLKLYLSKLRMYSNLGTLKIEEGRKDLRAEMLKSVIKNG